MSNDKKVPKLRFPEFTDDWEQRELGEIAEYKKGYAFKSEDYIDDGIKIIRVSDLGKDTIKESGEVCISQEKAEIYKPWQLKENDLIITTVGSKPPVWESLVGKTIYVTSMFEGSLLNQNSIRVRVKNGNNQVFLRYIFNKHYIDYLQTIIRGNANQGSITVDELFQYRFRICSAEEQEKIGAFFAQLDNTITLQQRKCEILKKLKKGLLQKMFPKNGSKFPELRFPEFTDAWEQRKLEEITDVRDGTHDSPKYITSGHPLLTSKNVKEGYINYDDVQFISDEDFEKINQRSKVDKNDILMGMIGTIGNLALIRKEPDFAIKNVALIKDIKQANQYYLYSYLQSPVVFNQFSNALAGGTQKFLSLKNIRELIIAISSIQEQEKIGLFFESLDFLITLQQRKLESLKKMKNGFLQQMFV